MKKTFETTLPEGYSPLMTVDATDKKTVIFLNFAAIIVAIVGIVLCILIYAPSLDDAFSWRCFVAFAAYIVYIVLHELTHGAAYKLLTGRKLTFGLTLSVAYCGVPDIYVYRKTAMISLLAPFTLFSIVFLLGAFLLPLPIDRFYSAVVFVLHLSGCAGDLYDTGLFLTKLRDPAILMRDTGPKQTFYKKAV